MCESGSVNGRQRCDSFGTVWDGEALPLSALVGAADTRENKMSKSDSNRAQFERPKGHSTKRKTENGDTSHVYYSMGDGQYHILQAGEKAGVRAWCGSFSSSEGVEVLQAGEPPKYPVCKRCASKAPKARNDDGAVETGQESLL
jgi:hypothetical protein